MLTGQCCPIYGRRVGPDDDDPKGIFAPWQFAIMVATAVVVMGIWFGYHLAFGRLAGAEGLW